MRESVRHRFVMICTRLKEKLPQAFMQIKNLTAKVWANFDNPIKIIIWIFKGFIIFVYVALSGGTLLISVMSQLSNGPVHNFFLFFFFLQNFTFHENVSSLFFYT